jgi:hypothetical protein
MHVATQPLQSLLRCPSCGGEYLHHTEVDVFQRTEDALRGQHTHVPDGVDGVVIVRQDLDGNPSPRRHGLRVELWCELCHGRSSLCLVQHKGGTYLHWERSLEPVPGAGDRRSWLPFDGSR